MKLSDAIDDFLLDREVTQMSPKGIEGYKYALGLLLEVLGDMQIEKMTSSDIRKFMSFEMKREPNRGTTHSRLSTATLHKFYGVTRTFVRWLYDQKMITTCLTDFTKAPRLDNDLPDAMTAEEVERMFAYLEADIENHRGGAFRNKVIFEMFLDTGLRMMEVVNLDLDAIHIKEGWLKTFGKGRKEGIVPMGAKLCKDLNQYVTRCRRPKDPNDQALFLNDMGYRLGREGMSSMVRRVLRDIHVAGKHGPHKLRHTFATNFLRNGGNLESLRKIMRHSSIKTTSIYTNLLTEDIMNDHRAASPLDKFTREHR